jgi:hypothetical protein
MRVGCRLWTCHRRLTPAAGCGVFLYELVPSGYPFICCLCETFFVFFFSRIFFYFLRKINEVRNEVYNYCRTKQVQFARQRILPGARWVHLFLPCVFAVLFLRRRRSCLEATIWAHNCPSDLLGGCWCRGGAGTSQVVSKWRATSFYKTGQKIAIPLRATDRLGVFFLSCRPTGPQPQPTSQIGIG